MIRTTPDRYEHILPIVGPNYIEKKKTTLWAQIGQWAFHSQIKVSDEQRFQAIIKFCFSNKSHSYKSSYIGYMWKALLKNTHQVCYCRCPNEGWLKISSTIYKLWDILIVSEQSMEKIIAINCPKTSGSLYQ